MKAAGSGLNFDIVGKRTAIIDGRAGEEAESFFAERNIDLIKVNGLSGARQETACHPDIFFHVLPKRKIVCAPQIKQRDDICETLKNKGYKLIFGETVIKPDYHGEIAYNVARVGKTAFHNLKYTDPVLRAELDSEGVKLVHVAQGYTKCSVSIVDEQSLITADVGIAKAAEAAGLDVLLIDPLQGIYLNGIYEGFIGGATGKLDNAWLLAGELNLLKDCNKIKKFLKSKKIEVISISKGQPKDIGTIIII